MYAFIRGQLVQAGPNNVVIDVGGIGYSVYTPVSLFPKLPQIGSQITLYTYLAVRELAHTLYGFLSVQEKSLFEMLLDISGIGPKLALSIVGHMQPSDLKEAVSNHNLTALCKIPGIGKKSAERLIIELRDKLQLLFPESSPENFSIDINQPSEQKIRDALSALVNLGYHQSVAQKAIKKTLQGNLEKEIDLSTLIKLSLKHC